MNQFLPFTIFESKEPLFVLDIKVVSIKNKKKNEESVIGFNLYFKNQIIYFQQFVKLNNLRTYIFQSKNILYGERIPSLQCQKHFKIHLFLNAVYFFLLYFFLIYPEASIGIHYVCIANLNDKRLSCHLMLDRKFNLNL